MTASILALQGQVYNSGTNPGGGTSTPITTTPVTTTPAAAVANNPAPAASWTSILAANVPGSATDVATASGGATYVSSDGVSHSGNSVQTSMGPAGVTPAMFAQIDQSVASMYPNQLSWPKPIPSNLTNPAGAR